MKLTVKTIGNTHCGCHILKLKQNYVNIQYYNSFSGFRVKYIRFLKKKRDCADHPQ